ncbi:MAG: hypothetical protein JWL90_2450 [Chthoniobacteraceae bacterium]|nr:hypothetical protein [Chthoniobacteraceae bacterium]
MSSDQAAPGADSKPDVSCFETGFPMELKAAEAGAIQARRRNAGQPLGGDAVGLAFSGGGIRSATFCLGVLQALAKQKLIGKIDYLSTVSGGSYIGGFFGAIFTRPWVEEAGRPAVETVEETLQNSFSEPLKWLRENGRYLSPNGAGDALLDTATYIRSWIGLQFLLSVFLLMTFAGLNLLRQIAWNTSGLWRTWEKTLVDHAGESIWWSPIVFAPALLLGIFVVPLIWSYWLTQRDSRDLGSKMPLFVTIAAAVAGIALTFYWHRQGWDMGEKVAGLLAFLALLALAFWGRADEMARSMEPATRLRSTRNRLSLWLATAVGATAFLLLLVLTDSLGQTVYALYLAHPHPLITLAGATGLAAFMSVAQKLIVHLAPKPNQKAGRIRLPVALISSVAALVITFAILTFLSTVTHAVLWTGTTPSGDPAARILARTSPPQPEVQLDAERRIFITQAPAPAKPGEETSQPPLLPIAAFFTVAFLLSATLGRSMKFLNLSSQQTIYNARLSRAYLGASNKARWKGEGQRISEVIDGDEIGGFAPETAMPYRPDKSGGPLHLINVTLNETVDGKSQVEQQDRKGLPMAIGPCGMSVGLRSHALWHDGGNDSRYVKIEPIIRSAGEFHHFSDDGAAPRCVERLDLGTWVAISGAAFSTGLGARTNLGMSLLAGIVNVRLGYWWDSLIAPHKRSSRVVPPWPQRLFATITEFFPAQMHLLDEFLARFHGSARRRWYLSDGGHFENTAAYELLRRRVPFIIICDDGQDDDYAFEDAANLVRKARLDFNAEIVFLNDSALKELLPDSLHPIIGTLQQLHRSKKAESLTPADREGRFAEARYSSTHATLAFVYYEGNPEPGSLILLIKPSLTGDEPLDVLEYHGSKPAFPQESTLDQFFDEAQWESYRRLGEHIALELFNGTHSGAKWSPAGMRKP